MRARLQRLTGWGNFRATDCHVYRPERSRDIAQILAASAQKDFISRGLGRSYGDSALNSNGVLWHARLNRMLAFDPKSGALDCEAGVSLHDILRVFLFKGFFLPVTPGTKHVTLGGAIAADVHGKNHHKDGSFGAFVDEIRLMNAAQEIVVCSREQNADLFQATIGGMGLTGVILSARIRLRPVETAYMDVHYQKAESLDRALELFSADDARFDYSVAWVDCLAGGKSLGRSVLMRGHHAPRSALSGWRQEHPFDVRGKRGSSVPFNMPGFVLSPFAVRTFNALYYAMHSNTKRLVGYEEFFYPLDSIANWNRLYGKRGFVQYQVLFPSASSRQGLVEILEALSRSGRASFLAVLKSSGAAGEGLLSYLFAGHTLALDIATFPGLAELLKSLDKIVLKHGGRLYLAKDACMDKGTFAAMYPNTARFKEVKARVDPGQKFASEQARRVGLVEAHG